MELSPSGHITPLAADTLRDRRITVIRADGREIVGRRRLRRRRPPGRVGSDHTGVALRRHRWCTCGPRPGRHEIGPEGTATGRLSRHRRAVALAVARGEADARIVIDGAGLGSTMAANKVAGVRAAMCPNDDAGALCARAQRRNVLTLGATLLRRPTRRCHRRYVSGHAHDRAALHPAACEDSGSSRLEVRGRHRHDRHIPRRRTARRDHHRGSHARRGAGRRRRSQCACHAVLYDCCPDRLRGVLDAGASRLGLHASGGAARATVAGLIDHTLLKPDATRADIEKLCREAARVPLRHRLRQPDLGGDGAQLLRGQRRRRVLGRRLPARRDDAGRQGTTRRGARSSTARARSTW